MPCRPTRPTSDSDNVVSAEPGPVASVAPMSCMPTACACVSCTVALSLRPAAPERHSSRRTQTSWTGLQFQASLQRLQHVAAARMHDPCAHVARGQARARQHGREHALRVVGRQCRHRARQHVAQHAVALLEHQRGALARLEQRRAVLPFDAAPGERRLRMRCERASSRANQADFSNAARHSAFVYRVGGVALPTPRMYISPMVRLKPHALVSSTIRSGASASLCRPTNHACSRCCGSITQPRLNG